MCFGNYICFNYQLVFKLKVTVDKPVNVFSASK